MSKYNLRRYQFVHDAHEGELAMKEAPEGHWCEYEQASYEIERLAIQVRNGGIPDWPEYERGYRISGQRIADLMAEYLRYRTAANVIPQPYLDLVSALSELAALRRVAETQEVKHD